MCGVPVSVVARSDTSPRRSAMPTVFHRAPRLWYLGLQQYFDAVISSEEVEKSKPEPDVFLAAAEKLHTMPENCLVVEDSAFGIEAGLRAGMQVMAVPYITDAPLDEIFSKSDILFPQGQTEFTAEKAMVWFNDRYLQE